MSIVKKWTSCVVSFIAGVLGLALSACSGMVVKIDALKVKETTKAFTLIGWRESAYRNRNTICNTKTSPNAFLRA